MDRRLRSTRVYLVKLELQITYTWGGESRSEMKITKRLGVEMPEEVAMTVADNVYDSPIKHML